MTAVSSSRKTNRPFARVAVIVRTKDRPIALRRAVEDILDQTYQDWIMIIVNDGGDEEIIHEILHEFAGRLSGRSLLINNAVSVGMQPASNLGIGSCRSEFIAIHDDDDTWDRVFLARTVAYIDSRKEDARCAGVVTWSQVIIEDIVEGEFVEKTRYPFDDNLHAISLQELGIRNQFPPISFLFKRSVFETVGKFREEFGVLGDWDFHLRVLAIFEIGVIPEALAGYHQRPQTAGGAYGNSVHALRDEHHKKRTEILNSYLREGSTGQQSAIVSVLARGQLHRKLQKEMRDELSGIGARINAIERQLRRMGHARGKDATARLFQPGMPFWRRTKRGAATMLNENGDFLEWPGPRNVFVGARQSYGILCPGFTFAFDGKLAAHKFDRRSATNETGLGDAKTYLRIANAGQPGLEKFFYLECLISNPQVLSGRDIGVSAIARTNARSRWIWIGGRYESLEVPRLEFSEQRIELGEDFRFWSCILRCPDLEPSDTAGLARVYFKMLYGRPFELDITGIRVSLA